MRTITTTVTVYRYDELSDEAKEAAVRNISEQLNGPWWDSHDIASLAEAIVWEFARELKSPGWDKFGPGDFPGIAGVELAEWDLERGQSITFKGHLTRDNAPRLPWVDGIEAVALANPDYWRNVEVDSDGEPTPEQVGAIREAATAAILAAWKAGRAELDHMESAEYAVGWIEGNEPEFTEDGTLYR